MREGGEERGGTIGDIRHVHVQGLSRPCVANKFIITLIDVLLESEYKKLFDECANFTNFREPTRCMLLTKLTA